MQHDGAGPRDYVFDPQEFAARQARVQQELRAQGFDGIIVADPANLHYLTGYDAWSFYVPQTLFLPAEGTPLLMLRAMDAVGAWRTATGVAPDRIVGYPEDLVHRSDRHPGEWMADTLREHGLTAPGRIGVEGDSAFFSVRTFQALAAVDGWHLDDSAELVNRVRLVKSPAEIELMRAAGRIASAAMRAALAGLVPGRAQNEVAADVLAAQARGIPNADGDYPAIVPMFPTGAGADTPHRTWNASPIPADAPISIELAGVHHRYHAPLARTAIIGRPDTELDRLAHVTVAGLQAAIAAVRPGIPAEDVAAAFSAVIEPAGYQKSSRLGYSIGIGYPPDWGERTVSVRAGERTLLAENMTFHLIAGMWMRGFGFEVSESVRVTDTGVEVFTDTPQALITLNPGRHL